MGKMIIFSAPSGAGKSTIVNHLLNKDYGLEFSISATTRLPRGTEKNGVEYYFLTVEDFENKIKKNEFIEFEQVYEGRYYGTLKTELDRIWNKGNNVVFDVDIVGGVNLKEKFKDKALAIFIMPPSIEELKKRLLGRGTDSLDEIAIRIAKAEKEISMSHIFDYKIVNDNLETAIEQIEQILKSFLLK